MKKTVNETMIIKFDISSPKKLNESKTKKSKKTKFGSSNKPLKTDETTKLVQAQLGDDVIYKKMKGVITGAIGNQVIISVQSSSYSCDINDKDLKVVGKRASITKPPFKFDEKTQKLLFEQFISCGIYMNNVPVKTNDCYVKYSDFRDAKPNDKINVMVEGQLNIMEKTHIQIYEDINEFANPEHYVEGVVIDEESGEVVENIILNVEDYTLAQGDADMVRVIRGDGNDVPGESIHSLPKAMLRTLSV